MKQLLGRKQKILLVSKFSSRADEYMYASSFATALEHNNNQVTTFNCKKNYLSWPADNHDYLPDTLKWLNNMIVNYMLISTVQWEKPDIIFLIKAENVTYKTVQSIQSDDRQLMLFYPDNPFSFWNGNSNSNVLLSLPYYDHIFIWEHSLIPQLKAAGAHRVSYFPFAYDSKQTTLTVSVTKEEQELYSSEVCFIGTWDEEREWWLRALIAMMPDVDLALWGNRWEDCFTQDDPLKKYFRGVAVYGQEMLKVMGCSEIALNFVRKQNLEGHNMRTFELLASGTFMLTQRTRAHTSSPFREDISIVCFSTLEELCQKIRYYRDHPAERQSIASEGKKVAEEFTLINQLQNLFNDEQEGTYEHQQTKDCNRIY